MGDWDYRIQFLEPKNVVAVVAGSQNSLAICGNRQMYTWGRNQRGTLGHPPETKTENIPSLVDSLSGVKIVQVDIAGGGWHSAALTDDGEGRKQSVRGMSSHGGHLRLTCTVKCTYASLFLLFSGSC